MIHEITEKERGQKMSVSSYRKYVNHLLFKSLKDDKKTYFYGFQWLKRCFKKKLLVVLN